MRSTPLLVAAALAAGLTGTAAEAKPATCFTSDDGRYSCDFRGFGGDGSFTISARGMPTYTISIQSRGVADGFVNFGGEGARNIFLPGPFIRSNSDRACWVSEATAFRVCAY
ncbi:MAG: hypothetical protein AAF580_14185 [Pseudomonadota bacterium]